MRFNKKQTNDKSVKKIKYDYNKYSVFKPEALVPKSTNMGEKIEKKMKKRK